jgi:hypothetical protein
MGTLRLSVPMLQGQVGVLLTSGAATHRSALEPIFMALVDAAQAPPPPPPARPPAPAVFLRSQRWSLQPVQLIVSSHSEWYGL